MKDYYWGFRFLARSLHYIQDIGNPYHTRQTSLAFLSWPHPIRGTAQATSNFHQAFEAYVAYRLQGERNESLPPDYVLALRQAPRLPVSSISGLIRSCSRSSHRISPSLMQQSVQFFGEKFFGPDAVFLRRADLPALESSPAKAEIDRLAKDALAISASATKTFFDLAYQDLFHLWPQEVE